MKKKALLIFLSQDFDVNKWKDNEMFDKILIKKVNINEKELSKAHPDTGEYKSQTIVIKAVTEIAQKIAQFLNECDSDNYEGYINIQNLNPILQMWTSLCLSREKDIRFVKVSP